MGNTAGIIGAARVGVSAAPAAEARGIWDDLATETR
jgi:hypothetical protein